jgi:hypothetical protein
MCRRIEKTGSFLATDASGHGHRLLIFISVEENGEVRSTRTMGGAYVRRIEKGYYLVVKTGVLLWSDDPAAP